jgi:hypothetical protein
MDIKYTDSDILDLYEDLQTVGLAETAEEEAARILNLLNEDWTSSSKLGTINSAVVSYLIYLKENQIPHTYATVLFYNHPSRRTMINIRAVIRGHVVRPGGISPLEVYLKDYTFTDVRSFEDLQSLKTYMREEKIKEPSLDIYKYYPVIGEIEGFPPPSISVIHI